MSYPLSLTHNILLGNVSEGGQHGLHPGKLVRPALGVKLDPVVKVGTVPAFNIWGKIGEALVFLFFQKFQNDLT